MLVELGCSDKYVCFVQVSMYASEIRAKCLQLFGSDDWSLKKLSLATLIEMLTLIGKQASFEYDSILQALLAALPGRIWDGKEHVLKAIAELALQCAEVLKLNQQLCVLLSLYSRSLSHQVIWCIYIYVCQRVPPAQFSAIASAVVAECARPKKEYRSQALAALAKVMSAMLTMRSASTSAAAAAAAPSSASSSSSSSQDMPDYLAQVCFGASKHVELFSEIPSTQRMSFQMF
jgi:hypothetical protein